MENEWAKNRSSYSLSLFITLWAISHQMQTHLRRKTNGLQVAENQTKTRAKTRQVTITVHRTGCLRFLQFQSCLSCSSLCATTEGDELYIQILLPTASLRDGSLRVGKKGRCHFPPVVTSYVAGVVETVCVVPPMASRGTVCSRGALVDGLLVSCSGSLLASGPQLHYSHEIWQHHLSFPFQF